MNFDRIRGTLHRVITTETGDGLSLIRVPKDYARRVNRLVGSPLATPEELQARRDAEKKLADLRQKGGTESVAREAAPVVIYFEKERNARELGRMKELLDAKDVKYTLLDVTGDEASFAYATSQAKVDRDQLPVVFIAGDAVGRYNDLVAFDVAGKLDLAVFGESRKPKSN